MFLNLIMLAGIGGALVPLILHLLSRSRYRTVEWGAMMFLDSADARVMQSSRIKQTIILLIRMAMIALLAMALAQPVIRGRWGALSRDGRVSAVIVLDCSASMGFDENGKTRMELARTAVLSILESLKENRVSVVLLGARDSEALATPTEDLQQLAQRILRLAEPTGRARLDEGLTRAMDILDKTAESAREIYLVCDRQASNWKEVGGDQFAKAWSERLNRAGAQTRFFVVPVGSEKSDNLAIEKVELVNAPAVRDQPCEVEVSVHNYGQSFRGNVELKVEDKVTSLSIAPDSTAWVRVGLKFSQPGSRVISAALTGGGLKFDDRMQAAIDVMEPIKVLILSGDERGIPLQNESDFLRIALAPRAAEARQKGDKTDKPRGDLCKVDVATAERWNEETLRAYQVVVLANVPEISSNQALALEQFVYEGGGLWIAPGNVTRGENYNSMLYRNGAGILPVTFGAASAEDGSGATTLQGISDFEHPIFRFLKGRPDPVPLVTIGRYFPVEVRSRDAKVLALYASGRPFLVEAPAGRGHVVVMTTSIDADWGTLPLSNFYLPFVQSVARFLTAGLSPERNLAPGQLIAARFGTGAEVTKGSIRLPGGETRPVLVTRGEARFEDTTTPGVYELNVEGNIANHLKRSSFVVRTPAVESDLSALGAREMRRLADVLGFDVIDPNVRTINEAVSSARGGYELWLSGVAGVIALSLVELAVVRRWSARGDLGLGAA